METFVIIGGSSTTGKHIVDTLLAKGSKVYASFNTTPITITHANLKTFQWDVREDFPIDVVSETEINGLVYCPGAIQLKSFDRIKLTEFSNDLDIQLFGAIKAIQALLAMLKKGGNAAIVMLSSVAARKGFPFHTTVGISKGAIEGLTLSLAAELAPKIRVNCVAPSLFESKMSERLINTPEKKEKLGDGHPLKRIGQPTDIAQMVCLLLSEQASWITGQVMAVDGGKSTLS